MRPDITIKKQRRYNRLIMRLTMEGIVVHIPAWLEADSPEVLAFIERSLPKLNLPPGPIVPPEEQTSPEMIFKLVEQWAARIGVQPKRVRLRTMYTCWGSCSARGNINLNRSLRYLPTHLVEYIVCHELLHLREFNHSPAFWRLMTQYMPDWKARKDEFKKVWI